MQFAALAPPASYAPPVTHRHTHTHTHAHTQSAPGVAASAPLGGLYTTSIEPYSNYLSTTSLPYSHTNGHGGVSEHVFMGAHTHAHTHTLALAQHFGGTAPGWASVDGPVPPGAAWSGADLAMAERYGKNWTKEEEAILIDGYRRFGPDWYMLQSLLPQRKGIISKWKRLIASKHAEAIELQNTWRLKRGVERMVANGNMSAPSLAHTCGPLDVHASAAAYERRHDEAAAQMDFPMKRPRTDFISETGAGSPSAPHAALLQPPQLSATSLAAAPTYDVRVRTSNTGEERAATDVLRSGNGVRHVTVSIELAVRVPAVPSDVQDASVYEWADEYARAYANSYCHEYAAAYCEAFTHGVQNALGSTAGTSVPGGSSFGDGQPAEGAAAVSHTHSHTRAQALAPPVAGATDVPAPAEPGKPAQFVHFGSVSRHRRDSELMDGWAVQPRSTAPSVSPFHAGPPFHTGPPFQGGMSFHGGPPFVSATAAAASRFDAGQVYAPRQDTPHASEGAPSGAGPVGGAPVPEASPLDTSHAAGETLSLRAAAADVHAVVSITPRAGAEHLFAESPRAPAVPMFVSGSARDGIGVESVTWEHRLRDGNNALLLLAQTASTPTNSI